MRAKTLRIRHFLKRHVDEHPLDIASVAADAFGITRQAIQRHLRILTNGGELFSAKQGRQTRYSLATHTKTCRLKGLSEDEVFADFVSPLILGQAKNVMDIAHHGFTEMLNNAIDHSGSDIAEVQVSLRCGMLEIWIGDHGIGAFRKIASHFDLADERAAVVELAKGRVTTDPDNHAGEGIFFTSRMVDVFVIWSNDLCLQNDRARVETQARPLPDKHEHYDGTLVFMKIDLQTTRTPRAIFDEYISRDDDFAFTKTRLSVKLLEYDDTGLVSRSQARRLMSGLDRFKDVVLDFRGVEWVGQGFADQVFRVWLKSNKGVSLYVENANEDVLNMIQHTGFAPSTRPQS